MTKKPFIFWIAAGLLLAGCGRTDTLAQDLPTRTAAPNATATAVTPPTFAPTSTPAAAKQPSAPALTFDRLANAAYHSVDLAAELADFRLENGIHYLPHLPGESDSAFYVRLLEPVAYGDLNGDGAADAAVILHSQTGGTAHYHNELAAVLDRDGAPQNAATVSLGERVVVKAISITNGEIHLDLLADLSHTGAATEVNAVYRLAGTELIDLSPPAGAP